MTPRQPQAGPLVLSDLALRLLRWLLAALAALMLLSFVYAALKRLHYPFEYDWIEDGMLASVRHLRAGLPLYDRPTVFFTPYLYTPLFLYASAALSHLTGVGYVPLRLVSLAATLGCFAVIYALVFAEVRRHLAALAAAGLFAACYPVVHGAFDVGRVDMLYLFFALCALFATRRLHPALAGLLWVCAFQTKQGVLPIAVLALCSLWPQPRRALTGLATFATGMAGTILWLNHTSAGWYRYYVFGMAGGYGFVRPQLVRFVPVDLCGVYGIALVVVVAALLWKPPAWRGFAASFYALGSVGMIAFTGYLRAHRGANTNSLLPAYAWIAVLFGVALGRLLVTFDPDAGEPAARPFARAALATLLVAGSVQLAARFYTPGELLPSADERAHREQFEDQLRAIPGPVLVFGHPEDALMAGKPLYAGSESVGSVIEALHHAEGDDLIAQYATLVHSRTLSAIALDDTAEWYLSYPRVWMPRDFLAYFPLRVAAIGGGDTSITSQPRWIYLACSARDAARRLDPHIDLSPCAKASRG